MPNANMVSALNLHKSNDFLGAINLYKLMLNENPNDVDANNLLASAYASLGDYQLALYHSNVACSMTNSADVFNNRARLFILIKKYQNALDDLKFAIKNKPMFAEAENNLSVVYREIGDLKKSIIHAKNAIKFDPSISDAYINLGLAYFLSDDFESSLNYFESLNGNRIDEYKKFLAVCYYKTERFENAGVAASKLIIDYPDDLDFLFIAIDSFVRIGRVDLSAKSIISFEGNHELYPDGFDAYLKQDLFFNPFQLSLNYITNIEGGADLAVKIYKKILNTNTSVSHALLVNLGVIYFNLGDYFNAKDCNEQALKLNPEQKWALNNLGVIALAEKKSSDAISFFERAILLDPNFHTPLGWLLKEKSEICDWNGFNELKLKISELIKANENVGLSGITLLSAFDDIDLKLKCMKSNSYNKFKNDGFFVTNKKSHLNKIKIAYYSYDFRDHPVAHLTKQLIKLHDRSMFHVTCYSYGPDDNSSVRKSIIESADVFKDIRTMSNHTIAQIISDDAIDILIDLTGDTNGNRSEPFKYSIAKIKAHWLGFIGTLGSDSYDYIIADDITIPVNDERFYTEKILRIPGCFHVCDDSRDYSKSDVTRLSLGIPEDKFVFAVCSQTFKITPEIFGSWLDILDRSPDSVIAISEGPSESVNNLKNVASNRGLLDRLIFISRAPVDEYLARFKLFDLLLDTFPYTSGTVASDSLFGFCPVLTLYGSSMSSRMCSSILIEAGLPQMVSYSLDEYIDKAVNFYKNPQEIKKIRTYLSDSAAKSQLLNAESFVKKFEKVLLQVVI